MFLFLFVFDSSLLIAVFRVKFGGGLGEDEKRRTQSAPFKSFGAQSQRKDKKGVSLDLKEQQQVRSIAPFL